MHGCAGSFAGVAEERNGGTMHLLKSCVIAFSIYSGIPVPQFAWKDEDMRYMLCFFPWVGAVVGGCVYLWALLCDALGVGELCRVLIGAAIPLLVTGGFHVDGFVDVMDAFHSHQPKERKLEILKDSHIGAFAVIMLALYGLIYMGAFSEAAADVRLLAVVCGGFFLSRCLSGIAIVSFPAAKKEGMLYQFASGAQRTAVRWALILQAACCVGLLLWLWPCAGGIVSGAAFFSFLYYYCRAKKELGGITGDTAGYFVLICEAAMMTAAAAIHIWMAR